MKAYLSAVLYLSVFFIFTCSFKLFSHQYLPSRKNVLNSHLLTDTNHRPKDKAPPVFIMPVNELAIRIGGSGKAKSIWSFLRRGADPLVHSTKEEISDKCRDSFLDIIDGSSFVASEVTTETKSDCGTTKFLQRLADGQLIESVLIPALKYGRTTLCVSTQIGCDRGCVFCATGKMGLIRNVTADEILSQVYHGLRIVNRDNMPPMNNIVFMGMGDAGRNPEAVEVAVESLIDTERFGMSKNKITVSTVGPSPEMFETIAKIPCTLAWSLHAADDGLRKLLVPSTKHTTVELRDGLAKALLQRPLRMRTIMIAATLVSGINDSDQDAKDLADFVRPLLAISPKIALDLIPYNDIHIPEFKRPSRERINDFQRILRTEGYFCSVRVTRGDDESAACGMLATKRVKTDNKARAQIKT